MRMPGVEFIASFMQHVLPRSMWHIRWSGILGPRVRSKNVAHIRSLTGLEPADGGGKATGQVEEQFEEDPCDEQDEAEVVAPAEGQRMCRICGRAMELVLWLARPTVMQILWHDVRMELSEPVRRRILELRPELAEPAPSALGQESQETQADKAPVQQHLPFAADG